MADFSCEVPRRFALKLSQFFVLLASSSLVIVQMYSASQLPSKKLGTFAGFDVGSVDSS